MTFLAKYKAWNYTMLLSPILMFVAYLLKMYSELLLRVYEYVTSFEKNDESS